MRGIRILTTGTALVFLMAMATVTLTAQDAGHGRDIESILAEIQQIQGVNTVTAIDPDTVSPSLLEELGDAVMDRMIGDAERHSWMDQMMGGEGSEQLTAAHRWMGYRYLRSGGGDLNTWGPGWMGPGMMGYGMLGYGMLGPGGMHGWMHGGYGETGWTGDRSYRDRGIAGRPFHPWYWMLGPVVLILAVVLIVVLVSLFTRSGWRRTSEKTRSADAIEILRARYARGEINRDELQKMSGVLHKTN